MTTHHLRCRTFFLCLLALAALAAPSAGLAQTRPSMEAARNQMVDEEIAAAGVRDPRVLEAMRTTPRHDFVPLNQKRYAYYDMGLPIGYSQTISAPFVVAYMTEQLDPQPSDKVLEIGTGSGYQAAVLSGLVREVFSIEIVEPLGRKAKTVLRDYPNVTTRIGDGYQGWPEEAPFDKIIVTCSPESVPEKLVEQLKEGGRMIVPVGKRYDQKLHLLTKVDGRLVNEALRPVLFVPMTGAAEDQRQVLPDPLRPTVANGDFEEVVAESGMASGWHYARQMEIISDDEAPSGNNYVTFTNSEPGRGCRMLQGMGVDGREVHYLKVSLRVRGKTILPGQYPMQLAGFIITFYDEDRDTLGDGVIGPWRGSFPWQTKSARIAVPPKAREAIVRVGLLGATGELSVDDLRLERTE